MFNFECVAFEIIRICRSIAQSPESEDRCKFLEEKESMQSASNDTMRIYCRSQCFPTRNLIAHSSSVNIAASFSHRITRVILCYIIIWHRTKRAKCLV